MNGILLIDKPAGITSHDVVDRVRKAAGIRRVGHTGTLDPAATGLLILCLGPATRLSEFLIGLDKRYEGSMRLGVITDSFDLDGAVVEEREVPASIDAGEIAQVFESFTGTIEQVPPMVSAVKVGGERLYKLARKGETVERAPRNVLISELTLLGYDPPDVRFRLGCSRGTYARALCHDIGQALGCGAVLASLRRIQVGPHHVDNAASLEALQTPDDVRKALVGIEHALELPAVTVRQASRRLVASGGALRPEDLDGPCPVDKGWVQLKSRQGQLLALAEIKMGLAGVYLQPKRVFASA